MAVPGQNTQKKFITLHENALLACVTFHFEPPRPFERCILGMEILCLKKCKASTYAYRLWND